MKIYFLYFNFIIISLFLISINFSLKNFIYLNKNLILFSKKEIKIILIKVK